MPVDQVVAKIKLTSNWTKKSSFHTTLSINYLF